MKKKMIAAGAASLALAAMPVVGVFAVQGDGTMTTTDTVRVTINNSCGLTAIGNSNPFSTELSNGATTESDLGSTTITITCNDNGGWKLSAIGGEDATAATGDTTMSATGAGTAIATGTSGTASYWAMKLTGDKVVSGFNDYHNVPSALTKVAEGAASDSGTTVSTGYQVHVSATQQADTYTGHVTYVLAHPNSN